MRQPRTPTLDERSARQIVEELLHNRPAYTPLWEPVADGAGMGELRIFARFVEVLIERLNRAPDKNLLAFLDRLGVSLIPAQEARAAVVFTPLPGSGDGRLDAGARLSADSTAAEPLFFETEGTIALAAATLAEIKSVWPQEDAWADHTQELIGGQGANLFEPRQPLPHELYLAHDTLLAFQGTAAIDVEFRLATFGSEPLKTAWEFWDGAIWQPFRPFDADDPQGSRDGTDGLTRSGVMRLRADCGESVRRAVQNTEAHWIRCRVDSLPPDPNRIVPEIDRLRVRSSIERPAFQWTVEEQTSQGSFSFRVTVREEDGTPIPDVHVVLSRTLGVGAIFAEQQVSDENGNATFTTAVEDEEHTLGVNAPALASDYRAITTSNAPLHVVYTLRRGNQPKAAFSDGTKIDPTKSFFPFGEAPRTGSVFYFSEPDAMSKPGATVSLWSAALGLRPPRAEETVIADLPQVRWEYWNGRRWRTLPLEVVSEGAAGLDDLHDISHFLEEGMLSSRVPLDIAAKEINGEEARWFRAVLRGGTYGYQQTISFDGGSFTLVNTVPPALADLRIGFSYQSPWEFPQHCLTHNDFQWRRHPDVRWPGGLFAPFHPTSDLSPTLYLGFDRPLPNDRVSLFVDVAESEEALPSVLWEVWNGETWIEVAADDGTRNLSRPGIVSFLSPPVAQRAQATLRHAAGDRAELTDELEGAPFVVGDLVVVSDGDRTALARVAEIEGPTVRFEGPLENEFQGGTLRQAALPRFGAALDWLRARLEESVAAPRQAANGVHLNGVWARQVRTIDNELLGSSTGQENLTLFFTQFPILDGEAIEVRELQGARAEVEFPILRDELLQRGFDSEDLRTVADPRTGKVREVWVRWQPHEHLNFSGPDDRHYVIERARGKLIFGDGRRGSIPPVGLNNIRARTYRTGGGLEGNVPAGAINQLLSGGSFVQSVTNPHAADGGADTEALSGLKVRGPRTLKHRGRAVSTMDYETLCREASPGVAVARALPTRTRNGRPAAGSVTVVIVPRSKDPRPVPSLELRERVRDHLLARVPASLAPEDLSVVGPEYFPVGVVADVVALEPTRAGTVADLVREALYAFLHPLEGGPDGLGWPFGRDLYLSDVAAVVESVAGVDHARRIQLQRNGVPRGERIEVPDDRILVAGPLRIEAVDATR